MSFSRVEVEFSQLVASGEVLGRVVSDFEGQNRVGKTVLAPFGAPNERAIVELHQEKKNFARGQIRQLSQISPARIAPPCPFFRPENPSQSCGGCAWQHLELSAQRAAKRDLVIQTLQRIGHLDLSATLIENTRGFEGFAYRNKADFVIQNGEIGFFAHGSHDLVDVDHCLIQNPKNNEILAAARAILADFPAWGGANGWQRLVARTASDGRTLAVLVGAPGWKNAQKCALELVERLPDLSGVVWKDARKGGHFRALWGENFLMESVNGLDFRVVGDGFWQTNAQTTPLMADLVLDMTGATRGQKVADLFCGSGLFALHLARAGAEVCGVESSKIAIENARFNAKNNGLNIDFFAADAAQWLTQKRAGAFDCVVLDPPRSGAREILAPLEAAQPSKIVWVSCDVATFSRDLGEMKNYHLERLVPLDLFPQTAHLETIALLTRKTTENCLFPA